MKKESLPNIKRRYQEGLSVYIEYICIVKSQKINLANINIYGGPKPHTRYTREGSTLICVRIGGFSFLKFPTLLAAPF